jgi:hypothetical protein
MYVLLMEKQELELVRSMCTMSCNVQLQEYARHMYLAINPRTNKHIVEILYRKHSSNKVGALSRRPELHHTIATAKQKI